MSPNIQQDSRQGCVKFEFWKIRNCNRSRNWVFRGVGIEIPHIPDERLEYQEKSRKKKTKIAKVWGRKARNEHERACFLYFSRSFSRFLNFVELFPIFFSLLLNIFRNPLYCFTYSVGSYKMLLLNGVVTFLLIHLVDVFLQLFFILIAAIILSIGLPLQERDRLNCLLDRLLFWILSFSMKTSTKYGCLGGHFFKKPITSRGAASAHYLGKVCKLSPPLYMFLYASMLCVLLFPSPILFCIAAFRSQHYFT